MDEKVRKECPELSRVTTFSDYADDNSTLVPLQLMAFYVSVTRVV